MTKTYSILHSLFFTAVLFACSKGGEASYVAEENVSVGETIQDVPKDEPTIDSTKTIKYLALGDSYTVGASVQTSKSFPSQLKNRLEQELAKDVELKVIATSGWRTDDLLNGVDNAALEPTYNLITLLIGVNNQYQNRPFLQYEIEFPQLLSKALALANGNTARVTVISIPDYAYTPFGQGLDPTLISEEIDNYNRFASTTAKKLGVKFIDITDITRNGLEDPELVAKDELHPSGKAYEQFVDRIAPIVFPNLRD